MKMKKFLMAVLIAITISTAAFSATSNDVHLLQDVERLIDAKLQAKNL